MKKLKITIALLLSFTILAGLSGCAQKKSHNPVNVDIENFEEIDYEDLYEFLTDVSEEIPSSETDWLVNYIGINTIEFRSEDMNIHYDHYNIVYQIDDIEVSYVNEDGIDTRDIEEARSFFEYQYNRFEEYYEDNSDEIIMEMQENRGYIIFDIEDPEIISAISSRTDVSDNTIFYGCIYFCNGDYFQAIYRSEDDENLEYFIEILDEFNLPHL